MLDDALSVLERAIDTEAGLAADADPADRIRREVRRDAEGRGLSVPPGPAAKPEPAGADNGGRAA